MKRDTSARFDDFLHSPVRLRICGLLNNADKVEFQILRATLELTDAHLSKNVKALIDGGYVAAEKRASQARGDARRLTWLSLTPQGRTAFERHYRALNEIASGGFAPDGAASGR
ncbi:transcriptional regulator [Humidisolicoccus flavus]|uniref:transcriptional regulator n=1 Tax=Humidisolicoccus flavus TaxID=3111414 RepID=UPI00324FDE01